VPKLASSVEQEIFSNRVPDQPKSNSSNDATNYMTAFLSNSIRSLIAAKITYQGISSQTSSGSDAVLDVRVGSPDCRVPANCPLSRSKRARDPSGPGGRYASLR
jgi:hypothetical protein